MCQLVDELHEYFLKLITMETDSSSNIFLECVIQTTDKQNIIHSKHLD